MPPDRRLSVADVAIFYGERSGGIRTYLEAKAAFAAATGAYEHHLVAPGRTHGLAADPHTTATTAAATTKHVQPSLRLAASNGYRIPLGSAGLTHTLRVLAPDVVLLHDPYWTPRLASRAAHESGAAVIAVHHSSVALHAAGIPGPQQVYERVLKRWYRRAYQEVDAVMSVVDPKADTKRSSTLPLRLGLDPAFHPRPDVERQDHVLYVGRLSREKGLNHLLDAAAISDEPWPLVLLGTGPAGDALRERSTQLGLPPRIRFAPYLQDRDRLAREYARARCVVLPGPHETFGLAALEAAACGTPVVTATTTPSASLLPDTFKETFTAGDARDLADAIARVRSHDHAPDLAEAAVLAHRHSWNEALTAELADLQRLLTT
jgi:alpha-1,6-mannosyltransferase